MRSRLDIFLFSSILALSHSIHGWEPPAQLPEDEPSTQFPITRQYVPEHFFVFPRLKNLTLDVELLSIYMQKNWMSKETWPSIFGPQAEDPDYALEPDQFDEECEADYTPDCCCALDRVCSTFSLRHIDPGGIGYSHGYTTIEGLFFPFCGPSTVWPYLDLRLHYFNNNEWAGNGGFGIRTASCCTVSYGMNVYFDFRIKRDHHHLFFPQVGVGFERLSPCFDFRINGYFPIDGDKVEKKCHFTYPGGYEIDRKTHIVAPIGADLEFGRYLLCGDCFRLYSAIGPYYYAEKNCADWFAGGRLRVALDLSCYVSLEGMVSYDNKYRTRVQGGLVLSFPFGCCDRSSCCQSLLSQPVWRNEIIPLEKYCRWRTNF